MRELARRAPYGCGRGRSGIVSAQPHLHTCARPARRDGALVTRTARLKRSRHPAFSGAVDEREVESVPSHPRPGRRSPRPARAPVSAGLPRKRRLAPAGTIGASSRFRSARGNRTVHGSAPPPRPAPGHFLRQAQGADGRGLPAGCADRAPRPREPTAEARWTSFRFRLTPGDRATVDLGAACTRLLATWMGPYTSVAWEKLPVEIAKAVPRAATGPGPMWSRVDRAARFTPRRAPRWRPVGAPRPRARGRRSARTDAARSGAASRR